MAEAMKIPTDIRPTKVGIVPCNGEEICEGSVTRFACRKVLDELRPDKTVTICLPLFVAGDEKERNFASHYPTITLDGCDKRCSAISTEKLSGKPARSLVVTDILKKHGAKLSGNRKTLSPEDLKIVDLVAEEITREVDQITGKEE